MSTNLKVTLGRYYPLTQHLACTHLQFSRRQHPIEHTKVAHHKVPSVDVTPRANTSHEPAGRSTYPVCGSGSVEGVFPTTTTHRSSPEQRAISIRIHESTRCGSESIIVLSVVTVPGGFAMIHQMAFCTVRPRCRKCQHDQHGATDSLHSLSDLHVLLMVMGKSLL